jgi:2-polyprenyl-3-methyl-5-hydroxy-6-metoxy-1,4-benzoquinol methylase
VIHEQLSFGGFTSECRRLLQHQEADWTLDYLEAHAVRLYRTYRFCASLPETRSLLSIGAGSALIEAVLGQAGVEISVVDFPAMIQAKERFYSSMGFRMLPADLSVTDDLSVFGQFDVVLASEIIEHIPAPPSVQIGRWAKAVGAGGRIVITTPNLGSVSHLSRLLFMRPLLGPPEASFGDVGIENEGVHRREYMPSEITAALAASGLRVERVEFTANRRPRSPKEWIFQAFYAVPRFRPTMMFAAARA